ncbi:twin-arginine translocase TatA/TatE family subunit [Methanolobus sediminis]|uniref:Sec-independent protein translocase protein TatA n=1 Tax=Methanolobus sediminis TaxID=3072978 RepID=A0AA51UMQ5_9EURY|nr:twin-arginine translocase TatA/TatE family subunit [Methanolobus sediminis]WMW25141.1 twin-arginine translocase TatA/TatE family subunit [Methanolobus sediminis]
MIGGLGPTELILIFAVIFLLFGAAKLPELARSMGTSMGEFKKAQKESEQSVKEFERSLKEQVNTTPAEETKTADVKQVAANLGIDTTGKSDDELLAEINTMLKK